MKTKQYNNIMTSYASKYIRFRMAASQMKRLSKRKLSNQSPMNRYIDRQTISNSCPPNFENISSISFLETWLIWKWLLSPSISIINLVVIVTVL